MILNFWISETKHLGFSQFYPVFPGFTQFYPVLPSFTQFFPFYPGKTGKKVQEVLPKPWLDQNKIIPKSHQNIQLV